MHRLKGNGYKAIDNGFAWGIEVEPYAYGAPGKGFYETEEGRKARHRSVVEQVIELRDEAAKKYPSSSLKPYVLTFPLSPYETQVQIANVEIAPHDDVDAVMRNIEGATSPVSQEHKAEAKRLIIGASAGGSPEEIADAISHAQDLLNPNPNQEINDLFSGQKPSRELSLQDAFNTAVNQGVYGAKPTFTGVLYNMPSSDYGIG